MELGTLLRSCCYRDVSEAITVPLRTRKSGRRVACRVEKWLIGSVVESQGERAGVNQCVVATVDGRILIARDGTYFIERGLV